MFFPLPAAVLRERFCDPIQELLFAITECTNGICSRTPSTSIYIYCIYYRYSVSY